MNTKDKTNPVEGVKERLATRTLNSKRMGDTSRLAEDIAALLSDHTRLEAEVAALMGVCEAIARNAMDPGNASGTDTIQLLTGLHGIAKLARTTLGDQ